MSCLCFISFLYSSQPDGGIQCGQIHLCLHFWIGFQVFPPAVDKGKHVFTLDFENKDGKHSCSEGFVKAYSTTLSDRGPAGGHASPGSDLRDGCPSRDLQDGNSGVRDPRQWDRPAEARPAPAQPLLLP